MDKKVTIRDVAREAGVSVATVSYVLNNRSDQKISPETKKKVLQIANLLQYSPSYAAKLLTTGKSNIIGIQPGISSARNTQHIDFINELISVLASKGYKTMIFPPIEKNCIEQQPNIDGIICIDLPHEQFLSLSDNYLIPIVCADMIVDHYLFFQIYDDYLQLKNKLQDMPQYTVLTEKPNNEKLAEYITKTFEERVQFCNDMKKLSNIIGHCPPPYITIGTHLTLCTLLLTDSKNVLPITSSNGDDLPIKPFIVSDVRKKAEMTVRAMVDAMERNIVNHDIKIPM